MKNSLFIILFLISNIASFSQTKEKTVGELSTYNLFVTITSDKNNNENPFHIVSQTIDFRLKLKKLSGKSFTVKEMDGYALTGVTTLTIKNKLYYQFGFYRSNGSPEIYRVYNNRGELVAKLTMVRDKTTYRFYRKSINSFLLNNATVLRDYDLMDLW